MNDCREAKRGPYERWTSLQRIQAIAMRKAGHSVGAIARALRAPKTTIYNWVREQASHYANAG